MEEACRSRRAGGRFAMTTNAASSAGSTNGAPVRAPRLVGQLWQVPAFLAGILALAVVAALSPLAQQPDDNPLDRDMAVLRQALEKPGPLPHNIGSLADEIAGHATRQSDKAGEAYYLLGALYLRQVESSPPERKSEQRERAKIHLELAELKGVPPADQARLTYLRGKLAFLEGANMQQAIELLSKSLPDGADNPTEGYGLLVQAHLRKAVPDLDAALEANLSQMGICEDEGMLTQIRMLRGELLLKKGMRAEAIKALDSIGAKAPPNVRFKARFIQAKAAMEAGMWDRAIGWWNELLANPEVVPGGKGRILYNLGVCLANHEQPRHAAEAATAWRKAQLFGGEEGQAAALQLAGMLLKSGADNSQALKRLQEALERVSSPADFRNTLVDASSCAARPACGGLPRLSGQRPFSRCRGIVQETGRPGCRRGSDRQGLRTQG